MKTLGDRVVPLDPLHPDASTPPARADLRAPLPNIGKFTGHLTACEVNATVYLNYTYYIIVLKDAYGC